MKKLLSFLLFILVSTQLFSQTGITNSYYIKAIKAIVLQNDSIMFDSPIEDGQILGRVNGKWKNIAPQSGSIVEEADPIYSTDSVKILKSNSTFSANKIIKATGVGRQVKVIPNFGTLDDSGTLTVNNIVNNGFFSVNPGLTNGGFDFSTNGSGAVKFYTNPSSSPTGGLYIYSGGGGSTDFFVGPSYAQISSLIGSGSRFVLADADGKLSATVANNSTNWNTAYNYKIDSIKVSGTNEKTIILYLKNGSTMVETFNDLVDDADADSINELQDLYLQGNLLYLTGSDTIIDLSIFANNPNWDIAFNKNIDSLSVIGNFNKELNLYTNDGDTIKAEFTDLIGDTLMPPQTLLYSNFITQQYDSGRDAKVILVEDITTYTLQNVPDGGSGQISLIQDAYGGHGVLEFAHQGLYVLYAEVDTTLVTLKQDKLRGDGFVVADNAGNVTYDNTVYQPLLTNPITGTGTNTYLPLWNSTSSIANASVFQSSNILTYNAAYTINQPRQIPDYGTMTAYVDAATAGGTTYLGTWNASTNTPTLSDATGGQGDMYAVSVTGTQNLGSGSIVWTAGGFAIHNGTIWQYNGNSNDVTSVNTYTGTVALYPELSGNLINIRGNATTINIANATNVLAAYNGRVASLTTLGNSGAATFTGNVLNIPNYTLTGLGFSDVNYAKLNAFNTYTASNRINAANATTTINSTSGVGSLRFEFNSNFNGGTIAQADGRNDLYAGGTSYVFMQSEFRLQNKSIPINTLVGTMYFDSDDNTFRGYNGTSWVDLGLTGAGSGTVTSVTAGLGLTQTGTATINPTLNINSHAGIAGSVGTINIGEDAIGVNLGTTSITAFRGDYGNTAYTDRLKWDGSVAGLTASTGRTSLGGTTIGQNIFTSANPSAIRFGMANSDNTWSWLNDVDFRNAIGAGTGNGSVTSISAGNGMSFSNITETGSITLGKPSSIFYGSTDSVGVDSHTHNISIYGTPSNGDVMSYSSIYGFAWASPAGGGDMYLANTQTVTGLKSFNSSMFRLNGSTSGWSILNAAAIAGTTTLTLQGTTGTIYSSGGTDITVADGGTGRSSNVAYALITGGTSPTSSQQSLATGSAGSILQSNGSGALPTWVTATGSGAPVKATSPTLVTPVLGVASATSVTISDIVVTDKTTIGDNARNQTILSEPVFTLGYKGVTTYKKIFMIPPKGASILDDLFLYGTISGYGDDDGKGKFELQINNRNSDTLVAKASYIGSLIKNQDIVIYRETTGAMTVYAKSIYYTLPCVLNVMGTFEIGTVLGTEYPLYINRTSTEQTTTPTGTQIFSLKDYIQKVPVLTVVAGNTILDANRGLNADIVNLPSNTTLLLKNISPNMTGNIKVTSTTAHTLTFAATGYTIMISPSIVSTGDSVTVSGAGLNNPDVYSYWVAGTTIFINGTKGYL